MAGPGVAAARHRPLHRLRRAHPRSEDRRSGAPPRARARLLLYRRARIEEDACAPRGKTQAAGPDRRRHLPHPRADWARYRRGLAGGDRGRDHRADHRKAARGSAARSRPGQGGVMKFGAVAPKDAIGATAVHTIRQGTLVLKKGTLVGAVEAAALDAAGIAEIVVARLEPGDVSEDVAAAEIATAIAGESVHVDRAFTGRANLFARSAGILVVDRDPIDQLNRVDEAITVATLSAYKPVVAGEMIATVKIIPFAVAATARDAALAAAKRPVVRVAPYRVS